MTGEPRTLPARLPQLPGVTGLRAVAALMVALGHAAAFSPTAALLGRYPWWQWVSFFFLLSGFVLHYSYPRLTSWRACRLFLAARMVRIFPAHLAALALVLALLPIQARTASDHPSILVANLALVHCWIPDPAYCFSFNAPSWSVSVEWFLYLCYPVLLLGWSRTWHVKMAGAFALIVVMHQEAPVLAQCQCPLGYLFLFTLGMSLASVWRAWPPTKRPGRFLGTLLEVVVGAWLLYAQTHAPPAFFASLGTAGAWLSALEHLLWVPAPFAAVIWIVGADYGYLSWLLSRNAALWLGEISYSIYLLHAVVLAAAAVWLGCPLSDWLFLPGYLGSTVLVSALMWRLVERPGRSVLGRMLGADRLAGRFSAQVSLPAPVMGLCRQDHTDRSAA